MFEDLIYWHRKAVFWQRVSMAQTGLALAVALACFATAAA